MQKLIPIVKSKSRVDIPDLLFRQAKPLSTTDKGSPSYVISSSKNRTKRSLKKLRELDKES